MKALKWVGVCVAVLVALAIFASDSLASDVKFGKWMKDPDKDRCYCEYQYPDKDNPKQINIQIMIWYPNDKDRKGYYYFANKDNKIWGRCVCPTNPKYDKDAMQWSLLKDDKWEDLPKKECPAPKDGDTRRSVIDKIPDPPV